MPVAERVSTKIKQAQNAASTINGIMSDGAFENISNTFTSQSLKDVYGNEGLWRKFTKGLKPQEYSVQEMDIYRASKENLKRQARGLKSGMDTEISKKDVARLKQKYGPIDQRMQQYQGALLDQYASDMLTGETKQEWKKDSHASLYRSMDFGNDAILPSGSLEPKKPWHKAKGSGRKVLPPSETDAYNLSMMVQNSLKNESILQYKRSVEQGKLPGKIVESKKQPLPEGFLEATGIAEDNLDLAETLYAQSRKNAFYPREGRIRG